MPGRFAATATERSLGDHLCWPFRGIDDLVTTVRGYVSEGLDRHELVAFCQVDPSGMRHAVISDVGQLGIPAGADLPVLTALTTEHGWVPNRPTDTFERMIGAALADGYAGLRVLTDATGVVRDAGTRPWWVRGEHLIDRFGLDHPLAVLCGYDIDLLGEDIVAEVACLHALTGGIPSPFLLRADVGGGLALVGEVDRASAIDLYHALLGIAADLSHPIVLDLSEHEFIDHSALVALDRAAQAVGTEIHLVGASPLTGSLLGVLELTRITASERP